MVLSKFSRKFNFADCGFLLFLFLFVCLFLFCFVLSLLSLCR